MAWRIHLTNQAIQQLHILPGNPPVLAVWTRKRRVYYYNLTNGTPLGEQRIPHPPDVPRSSTAWQQYVSSLTGPNNTYYLPYVSVRRVDIYTTDDGKLRVYKTADDTYYVETEETEDPLPLVMADYFTAFDLDRALGMIVALDEAGRLHIFQQTIHVGMFDIGLRAGSDRRLAVAVSRGGGNIYATDGHRLVAVDSSGNIKRTLDAHYVIGRMTCSPGGGMIITSDIEAGVLRAYKGDSLILTHQKFAIDLVADAQQTQLLADLPPIGTAISAIAAYSRGTLVFAMSGVVCVTDVQQMDQLPRSKALS